MRIKGLVLSSMIIVATLLPAAPARAGGATWEFEGLDEEPIFAWGEQVHARGGLWLKSVVPGDRRGGAWAGPQHGPFFGYLVPTPKRGWGPNPPPLPADAMLVGQVTFAETADPDVMDYRLAFVMPEVEPGRYSLLHCNDPCTRQIGDMMTTPITVVEDSGERFIVGAIDDVDRALFTMRYRVSNRVNRALRDLREVGSDITSSETKIRWLEARVAELERAVAASSREDATPTSSWLPWITGCALLVIVLLIWLLLGRRRLSLPPNQPQRVI